MLKKRLIPCLFLMNGLIVRSEKFEFHQILGNPIHQVERYNDWSVDELIYIDISRDNNYDLRRDDMKVKDQKEILDILSEISKKCFIPLTFGGKIRTIEDIKLRLQKGADKVIINTKAIEDPSFISKASKIFGSQCIVLSIDVKKIEGKYEVYKKFGQESTKMDPIEWATKGEDLGAGEIFLNSIDKDGTGEGYDLELIKKVAEAVNIPVIACGGVGKFEDFVKGIKEGNASAVAAGNIFNFTEISTINAKKLMKENNIDVRT